MGYRVMARTLTKGEKPLDRVGSSKEDFLAFPDPVKDEMGNALGLAQFGGKHPSAEPWKGQVPGVFELVWGSRSSMSTEAGRSPSTAPGNSSATRSSDCPTTSRSSTTSVASRRR